MVSLMIYTKTAIIMKLQTYIDVFKTILLPILLFGIKVTCGQWAILLDAGSTSTKMNVYKWKTTATNIPEVTFVQRGKLKPGISSYVDDEKGLKKHITDLIQSVKKEVPEADQSATPVYLFATAGMRSVEPEKAKIVMKKIRDYLSDKKLNPFKFQTENAQILSGEEEGVFLWVAVNNQFGFFKEKKSPSKSFGVMEIGGASAQIAFIPQVPLYGEEFQVRVAGTVYEVYVQSYFAYGANEISKMIQAGVTGNDPCMLKGDKKTVEGKTFEGSGDPDTCLTKLTDLVKAADGSACKLKPCAIGTVYQPVLPDITFYAFGAFVYPAKTYKIIDKDGNVDLAEYKTKAIEYCKKDLSTITKEGVPEKYASANCLNGLYAYTLATKGYKFQETAKKIKTNTELGWVYGALLVKLSNEECPSFLSGNAISYSKITMILYTIFYLCYLFL